jgi:hypothetical protein
MLRPWRKCLWNMIEFRPNNGIVPAFAGVAQLVEQRTRNA